MDYKDDFPKLVISLGVCYLAAFAGSFFTTPKIPTWYAALARPGFAPPDWVFGPVWIFLYTLMGVSAFLIWQDQGNVAEKKVALAIFLAQLVVNAFWSFAFFGLMSPLAGFVVILVLLSLIVATIQKFDRISRAAGLLLIPYLLWVSFAAILNFSIWRLNP